MFKRKERRKEKIEKSIYDNIPTISNVLLPDVLEEKKDYLYLGYDKYTRIFVMTIFPTDTWIGWLDDLFFIGNITISAKIEPVPSGSVINQLTKKLVQAQSEYTTYSKQGNILHLPALEKEIIDLEELRMLIQTNQDKLFFTTIFISLNAENLTELNEKTKILEAELSKKNAMIRTLNFRQLDGYKTTLPLGDIPISNYERNMVTGGVSTLIPISNPNLSHTIGAYLGTNLYTNAPVYFNGFIGPPELPNPSVFVSGIPGAGKSVALKAMTSRAYMTFNIKNFYIDVEGEYSSLCEQLGGKIIKIKQGESAGINPFELEPDYNGRFEFLNIKEKISDIRALFSTITRNYMMRTLTSNEMTEIELITNELYRERNITSNVESLYEQNNGKIAHNKYVVGKVKKKMPTLTDFQKKLAQRGKCSELAELLILFLRGNSMGFFDCESTVTTSADVICFNLSEIKDEFTKLYSSVVVLNWAWQKFVLKNKEKNKIINCDEGWYFLKFKEAADFLADVGRRGRKYHTALYIGSQFIDEFLANEQGKAIINICPTKFIFKQNAGNVDEIVDFFHLSEGTKQFLTSASPGECVMSINNNITAIKFEVLKDEEKFIFT